MALVLVIGAVALDRPIWLNRPLRSGGRAWGRSQAGELAGRLGGGAANAGCALRAAGHQVLVAAVLPEDTDGLEARRIAEAAGLDLSLTSMREGRSSKTLILIDPNGERTIVGMDGRLDGAGQRIKPSIPTPTDSTLPQMPEGLFIRSAFDGSAEWAKAVSGPVLLHWPSGGYTGEAEVVVSSADDLPSETLSDPYVILAAALGPRLRWVVITHGATGAVAHGPDETITVPTQPRTVCDTTGAGDIFGAGLLDALIAGAPMQQALEHACAWGGASVEMHGSAPNHTQHHAFKTFEHALQA